MQQTKTKKQWQKPDFYLLDSNDINAKIYPNFHENTIHLTLFPNQRSYWVKASKTANNAGSALHLNTQAFS